MILYEYFVSLNCVAINHRKGGDCMCIWPPKWVLMIMTRTIKELICLMSYEQNLKLLELKRASIDANFAKGTMHELH